LENDLVLVTGGSGFIAQYCILALLREGYAVRTTLRSAARQAEVLEYLQRGGMAPDARLSFALADLESDVGWDAAVAGCRFVMHGASPTPSGRQETEEDWIRPAVDGNLRVLRSAHAAGVKRVVLTSAFGAIGVGHPKDYRRPFDETDWSDLTGDVAPYQKSKTLSERAAWAFASNEGQGMELSTVNPVAVVGPALGADISHSIRLIKNLLEGTSKCPDITSCYVDVRDVADLHLLAMTHPAAAGQRFLATSGHSLKLIEVAHVLRMRMGSAAKKAPRTELPDFLFRLAALKNDALKHIAPLLGVDMTASGEKARRLLGWTPRPPEDAIAATGESLVQLGLVPA